MAAWSGFTDEDLKKMRNVSHEKQDNSRHGAAHKRGMARQPRQKSGRPTTDLSSASTNQTQNRMADDERLSTKKSISVKDEEKANRHERPASMPISSAAVEQPVEAETARSLSQEAAPQSEVVELSTDQALSKEIDNAIKFQQQQKVIEEANRQKRALLSKAIEERRKIAKAEAQKLVKIQQELTHLDTLLNADVGIIRDRIEIASLDYAQAQKRYEKAEKEFIESKMELFEKSEAKEKLTEHLYTIINQNETRKAKKLVELMEKLAMQISPEEMELSMPSIPQLTNFTAAATIHQPGIVAVAGKASPSDNQDKVGGVGNSVQGQQQSVVDGEGSHGTAEDGNCKTGDEKEGCLSGVGCVSDGVSGCGNGANNSRGNVEVDSTTRKSDGSGNGGCVSSNLQPQTATEGSDSNNICNKNNNGKDNPVSSTKQCVSELSSKRSVINENLKSPIENLSDRIVGNATGDSLNNDSTVITAQAPNTSPTLAPSSENPTSSSDPSPVSVNPPPTKGWSLPFT